MLYNYLMLRFWKRGVFSFSLRRAKIVVFMNSIIHTPSFFFFAICLIHGLYEYVRFVLFLNLFLPEISLTLFIDVCEFDIIFLFIRPLIRSLNHVLGLLLRSVDFYDVIGRISETSLFKWNENWIFVIRVS